MPILLLGSGSREQEMRGAGNDGWMRSSKQALLPGWMICPKISRKRSWRPSTRIVRGPLAARATSQILTSAAGLDDGHISAEEYSAFLHDLAAQEAISTQYEILAGQLKDQVEDVVSSHELASITSPVTSPVPDKKSH